ncbi:MAG: hypothetical protein C5B60_10300 [Chloroflexi bacterium]|nr:MAG: hypothetical protein C5B60_10300 [Chloroflexota bacterium]
MDIQEFLTGFQDMRRMLVEINQSVSGKQMPALAPLEAVFNDILGLIKDTHAKVKSNPPPASPAA